MIPSCLETFSFDTPLQACFLSEQVEGDAVQQREIVSGVAGPFCGWHPPQSQHPVPSEVCFRCPSVGE